MKFKQCKEIEKYLKKKMTYLKFISSKIQDLKRKQL